jgi:hypothetical protein
MKNPSYPIGNRTRDLPACSTLPQPTVPPRAPIFRVVKQYSTYVRQDWRWEHNGQYVHQLLADAKKPIGRSRWKRGLRCCSAAARLLGLWVRIPPVAWMSIPYKCRVLSGRGLWNELIPRTEESYWSCVCVCVCPWMCLKIWYLHAVTVKNISP